jgi:hypothetical protein
MPNLSPLAGKALTYLIGSMVCRSPDGRGSYLCHEGIGTTGHKATTIVRCSRRSLPTLAA